MKNILFNIFQLILRVLDSFFPKSDNTLIFPLNSNDDYQDNLRFLFENLNNFKGIDCVLLFYGKGDVDYKKGINFYTFQGIIFWLKARFIIIHHGTEDIPFSHSIDYRRRKLINLWHGIPLKNLGYKVKNQNEAYLNSEFAKFKSIVCSSKLDSLAMRSCFKKSKEDVWITGLPRNDLLLQDESELPEDLIDGLTWLDSKIKQKKLVIYMPTWRDDNTSDLKFSEKELSQLKLLLESENAVLGVKFHPNAPPIDFGSLSVLNLSESPCHEVGIFLRKATVLITDYSSVWVDFLLLDRQIVSYCPDLSRYIETRGLLYDYSLVFPGKVNETFESFLEQLKVSFSTPISGKQLKIKHLFHAFLDGQNSERVSRKILSMT